jgi:hypothetical protein
MKIKFIGTGSAFALKSYNTNFLLQHNGKNFLTNARQEELLMSLDEMFRLDFVRLELEGRMESRAKLAEPALHIPQQPQHEIFCSGCTWLNLGKGMFQCKKGFCAGSDNCKKHRAVR